MDKAKRILVTLTGGTCSGKTYLLNHIVKRGYSRIISTTTRPMRAGEVDGQDYYFITNDESLKIEQAGGFAEQMVLNGYRYGVTKQEFSKKLENDVAFLIVEPMGIEHYVKPAIDIGATHLKFFVSAHPAVQVDRLKARMQEDFESLDLDCSLSNKERVERIKRISMTYVNRMSSMLLNEIIWKSQVDWTGILWGEDTPLKNIAIIENEIALALDSSINLSK